MAYIQGEGRNQGMLFPVVLDDLVPADHMCRVVDAFVGQLDMEKLGFERAQPAETGRPGYDPHSLLKLYLYGYLNQIRSSRRLETECRRNVEVMWLLERLYPDYKSIAEFRRMHREAVTAAGAKGSHNRRATTALAVAFTEAGFLSGDETPIPDDVTNERQMTFAVARSPALHLLLSVVGKLLCDTGLDFFGRN